MKMQNMAVVVENVLKLVTEGKEENPGRHNMHIEQPQRDPMVVGGGLQCSKRQSQVVPHPCQFQISTFRNTTRPNFTFSHLLYSLHLGKSRALSLGTHSFPSESPRLPESPFFHPHVRRPFLCSSAVVDCFRFAKSFILKPPQWFLLISAQRTQTSPLWLSSWVMVVGDSDRIWIRRCSTYVSH